MRDETIDVVDAEANAFEVKRRDGAVEGLGLAQEGLELSRVRRVGTQKPNQFGESVLRRLTAVGGHVGQL